MNKHENHTRRKMGGNQKGNSALHVKDFSPKHIYSLEAFMFFGKFYEFPWNFSRNVANFTAKCSSDIFGLENIRKIIENTKYQITPQSVKEGGALSFLEC